VVKDKDSKFFTSAAQAAPDGTVRGLPSGVMFFVHRDYFVEQRT